MTAGWKQQPYPIERMTGVHSCPSVVIGRSLLGYISMTSNSQVGIDFVQIQDFIGREYRMCGNQPRQIFKLRRTPQPSRVLFLLVRYSDVIKPQILGSIDFGSAGRNPFAVEYLVHTRVRRKRCGWQSGSIQHHRTFYESIAYVWLCFKTDALVKYVASHLTACWSSVVRENTANVT